MSDTETRGSCLCGAVAFTLRTPVRWFQYCHCSRCRKRSGSAHAANLCVMKDSLRYTRGEDLVQRFEPPDASSWSTCFCRTCGSGLPWLTRNGKAWVVPAGSLDDDPGERPTRNVFFASGAPWYTTASELPVFDENPT